MPARQLRALIVIVVGGALVTASCGTGGALGATVSKTTGAWFPAAGDGHTCVGTTDGAVKCWGDDRFGQLGNGTTPLTPILTPTAIPGWDPPFPQTAVLWMAAGGNHTCFITSDVHLLCWGDGERGQALPGRLNTTTSPQPVPAFGSSPRTPKAVAAGQFHTCALYDPDMVVCWGQYSQTFNPSGGNMTLVPGVSAKVIAAHGNQTCAIDVHNQVLCWQLTADAPMSMPVAVQAFVAGGVAPHLAVGRDHACAVDASGAIQCWGTNSEGQLATGDQLPVAGLSTVDVTAFGAAVLDLAAGDDHTCAILGTNAYQASGVVVCWGENASGQTGDTSLSTLITTKPVRVIASGAKRLALGSAHSCATVQDASGTTRMQCWGANGAGQLGTGSSGAGTPTPAWVVSVP